jgi:PAS domain-containing protein
VSLLIVPVIVQGKIVGAMSLESVERREFDDNEIRLAKSVASAISNVFHKAQLITDLQHELSEKLRADAALRELNNALEQRVNERTMALTDELARRSRAEAALRESEERYALAVRGANDGIWDWDLRAGTVYYSDRWKSILGYSGDEKQFSGRMVVTHSSRRP